MDILDYRYWRCYLVTDEQARGFTVSQYLRESALTRLGLKPFPLAELKAKMQIVELS